MASFLLLFLRKLFWADSGSLVIVQRSAASWSSRSPLLLPTLGREQGRCLKGNSSSLRNTGLKSMPSALSPVAPPSKVQSSFCAFAAGPFPHTIRLFTPSLSEGRWLFLKRSPTGIRRNARVGVSRGVGKSSGTSIISLNLIVIEREIVMGGTSNMTSDFLRQWQPKAERRSRGIAENAIPLIMLMLSPARRRWIHRHPASLGLRHFCGYKDCLIVHLCLYPRNHLYRLGRNHISHTPRTLYPEIPHNHNHHNHNHQACISNFPSMICIEISLHHISACRPLDSLPHLHIRHCMVKLV